MLASVGGLRKMPRSRLDDELPHARSLPRRGKLKAVFLEERGHIIRYILQVQLGSHREAWVAKEDATVGIPVI